MVMDEIETWLVVSCLHSITSLERIRELVRQLNESAERTSSEWKFLLHDEKDLCWVEIVPRGKEDV